MPWLASSSRPGFRSCAPVNAPFSWPKISDSNSVSGSAAQLTAWNLRGAAPAQLVDHAGHDFLARPRRPEDQHRDVGLGRRPDPLEDDEHLLVAADHLAEPLHRRRLVLRRSPPRGGRGTRRAGSPTASASGRLAVYRVGVPGRRRTTPKPTSSPMQLATSRCMRPNSAISVSISNASAGLGEEVAEDAGAERRLHEDAESRLQVGRRRRGAAGGVRGRAAWHVTACRSREDLTSRTSPALLSIGGARPGRQAGRGLRISGPVELAPFRPARPALAP